jgi:hypothetical protein
MPPKAKPKPLALKKKPKPKDVPKVDKLAADTATALALKPPPLVDEFPDKFVAYPLPHKGRICLDELNDETMVVTNIETHEQCHLLVDGS